MRAEFARYANYEIINVEFIKKVPSHWKIFRVKHLTKRISSGKTPLGGSETYVDKGVIFLRSQNVYNEGLHLEDVVYIASEVDNAMAISRVHANDILLNITGASIGRSCLVPYDFPPANVNQHVCVIRLKNLLQAPFVGWSFKSASIKAQIDHAQNGAAREGLNFSQIGEIIVAIPPLDEQTQIAKFLDYETAKIDGLMEKQEQLIALLKEKRQAVISHAVTKGLNPNAPMRDSGIEWLGKVPAHWTAITLKHYTQIIDCKHITAEFVDDGIPVASIGEVKGWYVDLTTAKKTTELFYKALIGGERQPIQGDIIYTRNATVGEAALVRAGMPKFAMGQDVCLIRPNSAVNSKFLLHCLKSPVVSTQVELAMVGSTFKRINVDNIRSFSMTLPPITEQVAIVDDLSKKLPYCDALIEMGESAITLLQERRTALISAAVTGKIDVRGWQPPAPHPASEAA